VIRAGRRGLDYPDPVKAFWIYTGLRLLLFAATAAVVFGVWLALAGSAPIMWVLVVAFLLSGVASFFLLNPQRADFARQVDARAQRAAEKFEEMRAKEDAD
jgi:membrane protein implicated in regulation of membrane protease activity